MHYLRSISLNFNSINSTSNAVWCLHHYQFYFKVFWLGMLLLQILHFSFSILLERARIKNTLVLVKVCSTRNEGICWLHFRRISLTFISQPSPESSFIITKTIHKFLTDLYSSLLIYHFLLNSFLLIKHLHTFIRLFYLSNVMCVFHELY